MEEGINSRRYTWNVSIADVCHMFMVDVFFGRESVWNVTDTWQFIGTVKAHLHYIQDLDPSPSSDAIKTSEVMLRVYTDPSPCPRFLSRMSVSKLVPTCSDFLGRRHPSSSAHVVATADNQNGYDLGSEPRM